mgnify:FL=1
MNADGTGQARLTSEPANDLQPAWSPDGTRIAFTSARDGNEEIWTMGADGSAAVQLTDSPTNNGGPRGHRTAGSSPSTRTAGPPPSRSTG